MSRRLCNRLNELLGVLGTVTSDAREIVVGVVAPLVLHLSPTQSEIATIRGFAGEPRGKCAMHFSVVYMNIDVFRWQFNVIEYRTPNR